MATRTLSNREAGAWWSFGDIDFNDLRRNTLTRILGRHVITGMLDSDKQETDNRQLAGVRHRYRRSLGVPEERRQHPTTPKVSFNEQRADPVHVHLPGALAGECARVRRRPHPESDGPA